MEVLQLEVTAENLVTIAQLCGSDLSPIDEGSVRAVEIEHRASCGFRVETNLTMPPRYRVAIDADDVSRIPTDGHLANRCIY